MQATIRICKSRLSLYDSEGVELAFNTVKKTDVTATHVWRLKNIASALHLGTVQVEGGLPR